jgi:hypothetical protein
MRSKQLLLSILALLVMPAWLAAQDAQARIDAALTAATKAQIPVSLLTNKVAEGEAKRVPRERIAAAVESQLAALTKASSVLQREQIRIQNPSELSLVADALQAGVTESVAVRTMRAAPAERRAAAVSAVTSMVRLGVHPEPAFVQVNAALTSNTALANLIAQLEAIGASVSISPTHLSVSGKGAYPAELISELIKMWNSGRRANGSIVEASVTTSIDHPAPVAPPSSSGTTPPGVK